MKTIEYFYSAHSAYAYIGSKLLMATAKAGGFGLADSVQREMLQLQEAQ